MSEMEVADLLATELPRWQTAGLVTADTARAIAALYAVPSSSSSSSPFPSSLRLRPATPVVVVAMAAMSALLVAVRLLVVFIWAALARSAKIGVVFAVVAAAHACALRLRTTRAAEPCALLASLLYGAGIMLVRQALHVQAERPDGVWWAAAGVLPAALLLQSKQCNALLGALVAVWTMQVVSLRSLRVDGSVHGGAGDTLAVLPLLLPGLVWAHMQSSRPTSPSNLALGRTSSPSNLVLGLYVCVGALWLVVAPALGALPTLAVWTVLVGMAFIGAAMAFPQRPPGDYAAWHGHYRDVGIALAACALFAMSFTTFWERGTSSTAAMAKNRFFLLVAATTVVTWIAYTMLHRAKGQQRRWSRANPGSATLRDGLALAVVAMCAGLVWHGSQGQTAAAAVASNVCALALMAYVFHIGATEARGGLFALDVVYFLSWMLARYIDLFGGSGGVLGAALLFLVAAAAVASLAKIFAGVAESDVALPTERHDDRLEVVKASAVAAAGRLLKQLIVSAGTTAVALAKRFGGVPGRATLHLAVAALQLGVLGLLVVHESLPLVVGTEIVLQVRPVDPRDLIRGDYAVLAYDLSAFAKQAIPPQDWSACVAQQCSVYVTVERDRLVWRPTAASLALAPLTIPLGAVYLRGQATARNGVAFGIESFFVDERSGRALEARQGQLTARVKVAPWGQAKLCDLH